MRRWELCGGLLRRAASTAADAPLPRASSSRAYHTIEAVPRESTGSKLAVRERAMGRIPAVVLSRGEAGGPASRKLFVTAAERQIRSLLKGVPYFCSTTFELQVRAGPASSMVLQSGVVLPVKIHKDKETGKILNLILEWADEGSALKVDVPVAYKGEDICPGLQKGGYLHKMRSTIKYLCPVECLPLTIDVDLTNKKIGDKVYLRDLSLHPSLKLLSKDEKTPICKLVPLRPKESETKPNPAPEISDSSKDKAGQDVVET